MLEKWSELLAHNGSNTCETVICYLETWEGGQISVKRDQTCSVRESGSLGAVVVSTSPVCTE